MPWPKGEPRPKQRYVIEDFWSYVDKTGGPDACWPWTKGIDKEGYGRVCLKENAKYKGDNYLTHRYAWMLAKGPIPEGGHILHTCDNPPCCNPSHLSLGDHVMNMKDRDKKQRQSSIINEDDVREIRLKHSSGVSQAALAKAFGICQSAVSLICSRKNWKHVA